MTDGLVPAGLVEAVSGRPADPLGTRDAVDGDTWLRRLPAVAAELLEQWDLRVDGPSRHGECALVIPVEGHAGRSVLKITWPHEDARHEHLALRAWDGRGAVRLVAADPSRWAMLVERADPDRDLHQVPVLDACEVVGSVHAALARPALPMLGTASAWCARIRERLVRSPPPLPPRLVQQGVRLAEELPRATDADATLVHADLHYANVLAADRIGSVEGWLAIDPKPVAGEPALTVAPLLHNRWDDAVRAHSLRNHLRFRVDYACDPMGVDPARARAWTILRELDDAWWASRAPAGQERVTTAVTIIKAMQG